MTASHRDAGLPCRSLREIVGYFLRLGTLGFGGPVALVGLMERELVQERGWLTKEEMRDAIAVSQSLPGPLAIQVGIFIAYLRGGFWAAWAGGWAFILPNFLIVTALGALYVHFGGLAWMTAIFYGVSPAVVALIPHSCWRLGKLGMEDRLQWLIAAACFAVTVALAAGGTLRRVRVCRRSRLERGRAGARQGRCDAAGRCLSRGAAAHRSQSLCRQCRDQARLRARRRARLRARGQ